jgi:hypothetical protein
MNEIRVELFDPDTVIEFEEENIPPLQEHEQVVSDILEHYNSGIEPISHWNTEDLVKLANMIDVELQEREFASRKNNQT